MAERLAAAKANLTLMEQTRLLMSLRLSSPIAPSAGLLGGLPHYCSAPAGAQVCAPHLSCPASRARAPTKTRIAPK